MKSSAAIKAVLKYVVGFALLGYVVWRNWEPTEKSPGLKGLLDQTPDWINLSLVGLLLFVTLLCQFSRWYLLVRAIDLPFTYKNAMRLGLVGYFYNTFLPGAIGGDFIKAYFIVKEQPTRRAAAMSTVVIDRLFGLFGLLLFAGAVGGAFWLAENEKITSNEHLRKIITFSASAVAAAIVGWFVFGMLSENFLVKLEALLKGIPKVGPGLADIWIALRTYRKRSRVVYLSVLISAVSHLCMVGVFHCAVRTFPGLAVDAASLAEHFVVAPIGYISQVFFPAPGGVGGAEAIFGFLYSLIGRQEATGVVGRLTLRGFEYLFGLIGYLVFLRMKEDLPTNLEPSHVSTR